MLAWQGPAHVSVCGTKGMLTPKSWVTRASLLVKLTVTVELRGTLIDARSKARLRALTAMVTGPEGAGGDVGWGAGGCVDAAGGVAVGSDGGVGEIVGGAGAVGVAAAAAEVAGDVAAAGTVPGPTVAVCAPPSSQARVSAATRSVVRSRTSRGITAGELREQ
jgi:hypothetical protein